MAQTKYKTKYMKKPVLPLILLVFVILLSGCIDQGSRTSESIGDIEQESGENVTLNWLVRWKGEGLREELIRESAAEFEALNPNIKVNYTFFQDAGYNSDPDIAEKIVQMIESGDMEWDVVIANTGTYGDAAELLGDTCWGDKYLVDFMDVEGFSQTQKPFILESYLDEYCGTLVGPYIEGFYIMIWYNQEVADEIGINIKQYGMTFEDLLGYVEAVYDYNQEHGTSIAAFYESNSDWRVNEYMFAHLFKSAVGDFEAVKEKTFSDDKSAALLRTFQAMETLSQYDPLLPGHDDRAWYDTRQMSFDGTVLFTVNGAWMYSHWMGMDENKTTIMMPAELPVFEETDFYMGSFTPQFAVMKDSPHKQAAIKLIEFMSRPQIAEKWVRYTKSPTGIQGNLMTSDIAQDQFEQFQSEVGERYQGRFHFSDNAAYMLGEENVLLDSMVDELMIDVLDGEVTAQEAYDELMASMK